MPIHFRYDAERDLLVHVGEGPVSIDDIAKLRAERRAAGIPKNVGNTLTDMRRAEFDFDILALRDYEDGMPADEYAGSRHAEVVDDPWRKAILLLWREWVPDGIRVEIFENVDEAYDWLGVVKREGDLEF